MRRPRWGVLISGRGSNLQACLDLLGEAEIKIVYSSKPSAAGIKRARRQGVRVEVLDQKIDWVKFDQDLRRRGVDALFLAGFMKLIPESFVNLWRGRILNIHPSLLPLHPGLKALENSYEQNSPMGVTIHLVTPQMDEGPKLWQRRTRNRTEVDLREARFRISLAEQRLVRVAVSRWN